MSQEKVMIARRAAEQIYVAMGDTRVIVINGPRQAGKTVLARQVKAERGGTYVTLDDPAVLDAVRRDPVGFIEQTKPLYIDEFQRGGDSLLFAIKIAVDTDNTPGRFVLTGSSRFLTVPALSESLAGRVEIVDLWPLSQGEIRGSSDSFITRVFGTAKNFRAARHDGLTRRQYFEAACAGGFPAVQTLSPGRRSRWFENYARTVTQKDILELSGVRHSTELPKALALLAARTAQPLNISRLSNELDLPRTTLNQYLPLMETVYLTYRVRAWSRNLTAKVVRHPKAYLTDSGLAASLLSADVQALMSPTSPAAGPILETFVVGEIARQSTWSEPRVDLRHFRDRSGREVDLILESLDGRVVGVEVKAGATVASKDFASLELLRDRLGDQFIQGVVLYAGSKTLPFGDRLTAAPIAALWQP